jgi:broad specificity phosphatase PhoE
MPKLILIKHASPVVAPGLPPEQWKLSDEGKRRCAAAAELIRPHAPAIVVSSVEPKASESGAIIADALGVRFETADDLHEHDRGNVPHMRSREFISLVELFFRRPGERVLGRESADEALERFEAALEAVLQSHSDGNVAVVSHGTVIALFLEKHGNGRGFELWRKMGLPSFAVLERPTFRMEQLIDAVPG